jgi:hypothetical protein
MSYIGASFILRSWLIKLIHIDYWPVLKVSDKSTCFFLKLLSFFGVECMFKSQNEESHRHNFGGGETITHFG